MPSLFSTIYVCMTTQDLQLVQGDRLNIPFRVLDPNILLQFGWGGLFQVRKHANASPVISVTHTSGATTGIIFTSSIEGAVIVPGTLTRPVAPGLYRYQLQLISPESENFTILTGTLEVQKDLARIDQTVPESSSSDAFTIDEFNLL